MRVRVARAPWGPVITFAAVIMMMMKTPRGAARWDCHHGSPGASDPKGPTVDEPYEELAVDLISRTEKAVRSLGSLSEDTGIQFQVEDAVDAVERALPDDYEAPAETRRPIIAGIVQDILSGALYKD